MISLCLLGAITSGLPVYAGGAEQGQTASSGEGSNEASNGASQEATDHTQGDNNKETEAKNASSETQEKENTSTQSGSDAVFGLEEKDTTNIENPIVKEDEKTSDEQKTENPDDIKGETKTEEVKDAIAPVTFTPIITVENPKKRYAVDEVVRVKITLPEGAPQNCDIFYTLDGTDPLQKGQAYQDILEIPAPQQETSIILKAIAVQKTANETIEPISQEEQNKDEKQETASEVENTAMNTETAKPEAEKEDTQQEVQKEGSINNEIN